MNLEETGAVMDTLRVAYPQFYRNQETKYTVLAVELWQECFREDPVEIVLAALKRFILLDQKGFPPSPGMIKEQVWQLTRPQYLDAAQAWALVAKAVNTSDYEAAFRGLPEEIRQVVGSPTQLAQWGRMEESAFQSVAASNFRKDWQGRQDRVRERAITAALLPGLAQRAALPPEDHTWPKPND